MHKLTACLAAVLMCAALLSGCGIAPDAGAAPPGGGQSARAVNSGGLLLGYSQIGDESGWRTYLSSSIKRAAAEGGVQLIFQDAEEKQENQFNSIRSFIAYQTDVIAFSPIVESGWDDVLSEAKQAGIPVILVDRQIDVKDPSLFSCFIGSDFENEGKEAAYFLLKKFDCTDRPVDIVELSGTVNSTPAIGRAQGLRDGLKGHPNFRVVLSESGDFMRSKGKEVTEEILSSYGRFDVLYSHSDAMTLGALDAMKELGVVPGKDIVIVTIDGQQACIDALKAGEINCDIECNPNLGQKIVEVAKRLKAGEAVDRYNYSSETLFTEWDDLDKIEPRGY